MTNRQFIIKVIPTTAIVLVMASSWIWRRSKRALSLIARNRPQIAIVGDAFVDILVGTNAMPTWGADVLTNKPIQIMAGGSASNTTLQLGYLLQLMHQPTIASVVLHTILGKDSFGSFMKKAIHDATPDITLSFPDERRNEKLQTGVCICISGDQDRAFVTDRGSVATFNKTQIDLPLLYSSQAVHIAGFYNCPALASDLREILAECQRRGITTLLSPQYDATERWDSIEPLLPYLDVILPNELEATAISKQSDIKQAARYFLNKGVGKVVMTLGPQGAYALLAGDEENGNERKEYTQACPKVQEVVDTTGAGDAFVAGFLYSYLLISPGDIPSALKWGVAAGSACVTKVGASVKPTNKELLANLVT